MKNLISIIMPAKNGEKYIKEAIESVKNQGVDIEILVVNDGSDDKTEEIAKNMGCKVITNMKSCGPVIAKNQALKIAKGDYIIFCDCDDIMREGTLLRLLSELKQDKSISAVCAKVKDFISDDIPEDEKQKTVIKPEPYWGLFTCAILMRKSVFDTIGYFNESVTAGEIIDWQSKMDKNNLKIKKLDFISTDRRIHTSNFGKTQQKKEFKDYAALLREKLRK